LTHAGQSLERQADTVSAELSRLQPDEFRTLTKFRKGNMARLARPRRMSADGRRALSGRRADSIGWYSPTVVRNLVTILTARLQYREEHLESMTIRNPTQRLARQLLLLEEALARANGVGLVIDVHLTHQALADMIGVRRETITVRLHRLIRAGAVRRDRGRTVIQPVRLSRLLDDGLPEAPTEPLSASRLSRNFGDRGERTLWNSGWAADRDGPSAVRA
jgi:hypothetical protein